jgi:transposase
VTTPFAVMPFGNLIFWHSPVPPFENRTGELITSGTKNAPPQRDISPTHKNAAAVGIGATMHVTAVGPDKASEPVRSFGTFTGDLHRLADWFEQCDARTIAMESMGVYWIPVFEILDQRGFEVILVNARDAKHVPGRKTDIGDAQWRQRLHEYGLLRASFRLKGEVAIIRAYSERCHCA